jgi:hypothetical protein
MKAVMETSDAVRPAARMTADELVDGTDDDGAMFVGHALVNKIVFS